MNKTHLTGRQLRVLHTAFLFSCSPITRTDSAQSPQCGTFPGACPAAPESHSLRESNRSRQQQRAFVQQHAAVRQHGNPYSQQSCSVWDPGPQCPSKTFTGNKWEQPASEQNCTTCQKVRITSVVVYLVQITFCTWTFRMYSGQPHFSPTKFNHRSLSLTAHPGSLFLS